MLGSSCNNSAREGHSGYRNGSQSRKRRKASHSTQRLATRAFVDPWAFPAIQLEELTIEVIVETRKKPPQQDESVSNFTIKNNSSCETLPNDLVTTSASSIKSDLRSVRVFADGNASKPQSEVNPGKPDADTSKAFVSEKLCNLSSHVITSSTQSTTFPGEKDKQTRKRSHASAFTEEMAAEGLLDLARQTSAKSTAMVGPMIKQAIATVRPLPSSQIQVVSSNEKIPLTSHSSSNVQLNPSYDIKKEPVDEFPSSIIERHCPSIGYQLSPLPDFQSSLPQQPAILTQRYSSLIPEPPRLVQYQQQTPVHYPVIQHQHQLSQEHLHQSMGELVQLNTQYVHPSNQHILPHNVVLSQYQTANLSSSQTGAVHPGPLPDNIIRCSSNAQPANIVQVCAPPNNGMSIIQAVDGVQMVQPLTVLPVASQPMVQQVCYTPVAQPSGFRPAGPHNLTPRVTPSCQTTLSTPTDCLCPDVSAKYSQHAACVGQRNGQPNFIQDLSTDCHVTQSLCHNHCYSYNDPNLGTTSTSVTKEKLRADNSSQSEHNLTSCGHKSNSVRDLNESIEITSLKMSSCHKESRLSSRLDSYTQLSVRPEDDQTFINDPKYSHASAYRDIVESQVSSRISSNVNSSHISVFDHYMHFVNHHSTVSSHATTAFESSLLVRLSLILQNIFPCTNDIACKRDIYLVLNKLTKLISRLGWDVLLFELKNFRSFSYGKSNPLRQMCKILYCRVFHHSIVGLKGNMSVKKFFTKFTPQVFSELFIAKLFDMELPQSIRITIPKILSMFSDDKKKIVLLNILSSLMPRSHLKAYSSLIYSKNRSKHNNVDKSKEVTVSLISNQQNCPLEDGSAQLSVNTTLTESFPKTDNCSVSGKVSNYTLRNDSMNNQSVRNNSMNKQSLLNVLHQSSMSNEAVSVAHPSSNNNLIAIDLPGSSSKYQVTYHPSEIFPSSADCSFSTIDKFFSSRAMNMLQVESDFLEEDVNKNGISSLGNGFPQSSVEDKIIAHGASHKSLLHPFHCVAATQPENNVLITTSNNKSSSNSNNKPHVAAITHHSGNGFSENSPNEVPSEVESTVSSSVSCSDEDQESISVNLETDDYMELPDDNSAYQELLDCGYDIDMPLPEPVSVPCRAPSELLRNKFSYRTIQKNKYAYLKKQKTSVKKVKEKPIMTPKQVSQIFAREKVDEIVNSRSPEQMPSHVIVSIKGKLFIYGDRGDR